MNWVSSGLHLSFDGTSGFHLCDTWTETWFTSACLFVRENKSVQQTLNRTVCHSEPSATSSAGQSQSEVTQIVKVRSKRAQIITRSQKQWWNVTEYIYSSSKCIKCIFEVALNSSNSIFCYVTLPLDFGEYYTFLSFMIIITEFIHFISNRIKKKNPLILMFRKRLNIQANNLFFTFYFWYLRKCNTPYFKTLAWVMLARWL